MPAPTLQTHHATLWMLGATALRMGLALVAVKVTAVLLGAEGIGVAGQFATLLHVATALAGGGIAVGIVQLLSDPRAAGPDRSARLATGHGYALAVWVLTLVLVLALHQPLAALLLPVPQGGALLVALALAQWALFRAAALTAVLNSAGHQSVVAVAQVVSGGLTVLAVSLGALAFGLTGALAGTLVGAAGLWGVLLLLTRRARLPLACLGRARLSGAALPFWWGYTLVALVSVVGMPLAQIVVRHALVQDGGWAAAGTWQATLRLSDAYMQFGLVVLASVCLPLLAASSSAHERRLRMLRMAARLLPVAVAVGLGVYLVREPLVSALFTPAFAPSADLVLPQVLGDVLRMTSYLMTYTLLSAGHPRLVIAAEVLQALLFLGMAFGFGLSRGPLGVAWSHCATYVLYLPLVLAATLARLARDARAREAAA